MSGPKLSEYLLEEQRRKMQQELERQLREKARAQSCRQQAEDAVRRLDELCRMTKRDMAEKEKWLGLQKSARIYANKCAGFLDQDLSGGKNCDALVEEWKRIDAMLSFAWSALSRIQQMNDEQQEHEKRMQSDGGAEALKRAAKFRGKTMQRNESAPLKLDLQKYLPQAEEIQREVQEEIAAWQSEDSDFASQTLERLELIAGKYMSDPRVQMNMLKSFMRERRAMWKKRQAALVETQSSAASEAQTEVLSLTLRYELLCRRMGLVPENLSEEQMTERCEIMESTLLDEQCRHQAADTVRECMEEMGYHLLADKQDGYVEQHVYQVQGDTVIQVCMNSSGQLLMEVGRADLVERGARIDEIDELVDDMKKFCTAHAQIRNKLLQKGVRLKELLYEPPVAQNARIINLSDYVPDEAAAPAAERHSDNIQVQESGGARAWH